MYRGFYSFFSVVLLFLFTLPTLRLPAMFMLFQTFIAAVAVTAAVYFGHKVGCGKTNFIVYTVSVLPYCWFRMNYLYKNSTSEGGEDLKDDGLSVCT